MLSLSSKINFCGISPIISTGNLNIIFIDKAIINPIKDDGIILLSFFGHISMITTTNIPIERAYQFGFNGVLKKFNTFIAADSDDLVDTPKKLSNCPIAIINAIPDVNPVTTGVGIYDTTFPNFNIPAKIRINPANAPAIHTPSNPYFWNKATKIALIAPVGPDIWNDPPDKAPITTPANIAVIKPAAAVAPELTPKANANGNAIAVTVIPAIKSCLKFNKSYPLNSFLMSLI